MIKDLKDLYGPSLQTLQYNPVCFVLGSLAPDPALEMCLIITCELAEGTLFSIIHGINEDAKKYWPWLSNTRVYH